MRGGVATGLVAVAAAAVGAAVAHATRPRERAAPAASRVLTVAFSGEDEGHLEPCGCTPAMLGGLARRPARLAASREPGVPFVYVAGARLVAGDGEYDRLRLRAVLEALGSMGCAAYGPSAAERALLDAGEERSVAIADEDPLAVAAGSARVHVVAPAGDASDAIRRARARLGATAPLVALTVLGEEAARACASGAEGPTLVLFPSGNTDPAPQDAVHGRAAAAPYPAHGKFLGLAHLAGEGGAAAWAIEYRPVVPDLAEDERIVALRAAHLDALRAAGIAERSAGDARFAVGTRATQPYAGSASCAECHPEASATWASSRHAGALATLERTGDDADPACVKCHVVGYGTPHGWRPSRGTPPLGDVGCEACHGPRAVHVRARAAGEKDEPAPPFGERGCLLCHDGEHHPLFDFADAWPRIAHDTR